MANAAGRCMSFEMATASSGSTEYWHTKPSRMGTGLAAHCGQWLGGQRTVSGSSGQGWQLRRLPGRPLYSQPANLPCPRPQTQTSNWSLSFRVVCHHQPPTHLFEVLLGQAEAHGQHEQAHPPLKLLRRHPVEAGRLKEGGAAGDERLQVHKGRVKS